MKQKKPTKKILIGITAFILSAVLVVCVVVTAVLLIDRNENKLSVGTTETLILGKGSADNSDALIPGDSVNVTFELEVSDYEGTATFSAYLLSDAEDFYQKYFTVTWTVAGESRSTVTSDDNGKSVVVSVKMNDESAGEGNYYVSTPSFRSVTLIACLSE